jgi:ribosomal protein S15P/S13E
MPITTVDPHQVKRWVRSDFKQRFAPSIDSFELYLDFENIAPHDRQLANAWNEAAARVFAANFIEIHPEYAEEEIVENFTTHIVTLRKHFKAYMNDDPHANAENLKDKASRQRRMNVGLFRVPCVPSVSHSIWV